MDDALAAVDGHVAMRIWRNVCEFRRRRGLTTLMSLNQRQFLPLFDRYVELKNGRIVREVVNTKKKEQKKEEEEEEKQEKELNEIDEKCGDEGKSVMIEKKDDLISEETRRLGALDMSAFTFFFKRVGGWRYAISVVVLGIFAYALMAAGDLWLAAWVRSPLFYFHSLHFLGQQHTHTHIYIYIYQVAEDGSFGGHLSDTSRAIGYVSFSLGHAFLVLTLSSWDAYSINEACRAIHGDCLDKLLKAPSSWYQSTLYYIYISSFYDLKQMCVY